MKKDAFFVIGAIFIVLVILNYSSFGTSLSSYLQKQVATWGFYGLFILVFVLEFLPQPLISSLLPVSAGLFFQWSFIYVLLVSVVAAVSSNYSKRTN
ncbi:MAG: hypothetical protein KKD18_01335 [Nanoarchaeota archaeon]|nr:hypothetical protein [Nanoarchaeota archaeon]